MTNKGSKTAAIVPARKGSKGLPGKALKRAGGLSLIAHAARCARLSRRIDFALASTDCPKIAREAEKHGLAAPFLRPPALAGDKTPMIDVLRHALENLPSGTAPEIIVLLQPTSPLRTAATVDKCIERFLSSGARSAASVTRAKTAPQWMRRINAQGRLERLEGFKEDITDRQSLPAFWYFNGAVYITTPALIAEGRILDEAPLALEIPEDEAVDIDTALDLELARALFRARKKGKGR